MRSVSGTLRGRPFLTASLAATALLVAAPLVHTQDAAGQRATTVFRSTSNFVRVDVVVRDRNGSVVKGLKNDDFVVTEDGKPQQVVTFDYEEIATDTLPPATPSTPVLGLEQLQNAATRSAAPPTSRSATAAATPAPAETVAPQDMPGRRLIVLLFDTSSMQPEEIDRAVKSAQTYVDSQMSTADLVAVASVGQSLTILHDFTADRDVLKTALANFDVTSGTGFEQPVAADTSDVTSDTDPADLPLDDSEFGIFNNDRRLRAMKMICDTLAPIEQKKAILYFSSGMSRSGSDNQVELRALINAANMANTSIYPVDSRGLTAVVPGGAAGGGGAGGGGRGGAAGSSVFSGRSMLSQFSSLNGSQETLSTIAGDTGGQAFLDSNDFSGAFTRVQHDMSAYYLLGYSSTNALQDGKYRRISVKLKNTSLGYRLEARDGYYAPSDFAHLKKEDKEKQLQDQIASAVSLTDVPVMASTSWFRVSADRFYVPVSIAVPGSSIHLPASAASDKDKDKKGTSLDLLGVVTDEQGRSVGRIRDTMELSPAQVASLDNKQLQYQSGVPLPAGHFKVKVAVRENSDGAMGTFEFPITIPDLKATPVKVSPIVLSTQLRAGRGGFRGGGPGGPGGPGGFPGRGGPGGFGPGGFVSQRGGGFESNTMNPLLRGGQEIVQSLSHVVTQAQQMYFYYEVYDPTLAGTGAAAAPHIRTNLAFYRGRVKVFETPVVDRTTIDDPERKAIIFQFQMSGADLKPGLYTCQVNVVDDVAGTFAFPRLAVYVKEK